MGDAYEQLKNEFLVEFMYSTGCRVSELTAVKMSGINWQDSTVTHNGKTWVSDINGNVWEPGVYGWIEIK